MATPEPKSEAKPEPKEVEENSAPCLKYKIWVLKVSIHCEGCKKKIQRTLKGIDGVYETDVNMKLQKVTVIGNVEPETLIKKLTKSGRHAGLWADQKGNNNSTDKKKNKGKNKEDSKESSHGGGGGGDNEKVTVKVEVVQAQQSANKNKNEGGGSGGNKKVDGGNNGKGNGGANSPAQTGGGGGGGGAPAKNGGGGGAPVKNGGGVGGQVKDSKPEVVRQTVNLQKQSTVAQKKSGGGGPGGESDCQIEKCGGGGGGGASGSGAKKNKEVEIENANVDDEDSEDEEEWGEDEPPRTEAPHHGNVVGRGPHGPQMSHVPFVPNPPRGLSHGPRGPAFGPQGPAYGAHGPSSVQVPTNNNPPRYQNINDYQQPGQQYRPQQQAVHYNAAYPTNGYGAPYYASPISHANAYAYAPQDLEAGTQPPSSYHLDAYPPPPYYPPQPSYNPPQPSDSFGLFSDENPNGCHVM